MWDGDSVFHLKVNLSWIVHLRRDLAERKNWETKGYSPGKKNKKHKHTHHQPKQNQALYKSLKFKSPRREKKSLGIRRVLFGAPSEHDSIAWKTRDKQTVFCFVGSMSRLQQKGPYEEMCFFVRSLQISCQSVQVFHLRFNCCSTVDELFAAG